MSVVWMAVGAVTDGGATFSAKVDGGGPVRVAVATDAAMTSPAFTSSQVVDAQGVAKVAITGLAADTRHWWRVEDNSTIDTSVTGQVLTDPPVGLAASFTIAASSCAGLDAAFPGSGSELAPSRISNHPIFDTIRVRALAEGWRRFCHEGDDLYYDLGSGSHGIVGGASLANYRTARNDLFAQSRQGRLYRELATTRQADDHDRAFNNHDSTFTDALNYNTVYREVEPSYTLPDGASNGGTYHSFQIGRVLFIAADVRTFRSPNSATDDASKTMLGSAQKSWMSTLLAGSDAKFLVWLMPSQWNGVSTDSWAVFTTERAEMVALFDSTGFLSRMAIVAGDWHGSAIDTGVNTAGGIPTMQAGPLDSSAGIGPTGTHNLGTFTERAQYGTVAVGDFGTHLTITLTAWRDETELVSYTLAVDGDPPASLATGALLRTLAGSHRPLFEARVLADFQTGDDPDGDTILFTGGGVDMDGTADIQRTLTLHVAGEQFPRRLGDKLLPDGTEVFVRRGVDLGSDVIWVPLGYFRIEDDQQDNAPDGPITIAGFDRMKSIIDSKLLAPRQFPATATFAAVFSDLVTEVYPDAAIIFDDDLGSEPVGRLLIVEESRYEPLRTLASGRGKIVHWDGRGVLRIRTAPDPDEPVWEVRAGRSGVLIRASRRVTRSDVVNAVVVRSQGGDSQAPARAVAIDDGPHSVTRFGGRFGKVPAFISTPATTTPSQAADAARQTLLRRAGLPHQMTLTTVVNPALQPWDPVRSTLRDGTRDKHVLQRLTVPLSADAAMTAETREQRQSRVVVVT